jgi:DNA-binding beta-propeller fold protein YncE
MIRRMCSRLAVMSALCAVAALPAAPATLKSSELPGRLPDGRTRLASGWFLSPAGRQVRVGDFPQHVCVSPDERWAIVSHSDYGKFGLTVVDLDSARTVQEISLPSGWLGATFLVQGTRIAAAGGLTNRIYLYEFADGRARLADSVALGPPWSAGGQYPQGRVIDYGAGAIWPTGLSADDAHERLYVVSLLDSSLYVLDLRRGSVLRRIALPAVPFTCLVSRGGDRVFVSLWSGAGVALVDASSLAVVKVVPVGDHPCEMVETQDGTRLFVANANHNTVSILDLREDRVIETLTSAPDPKAPAGSTPNAVALDHEGRRLYVANADNNCLAVLDVSRAGHTRPLGFVPTGYYPTGVVALPKRGTILVSNGKGMGSGPSSAAPPHTGSWRGYQLYGSGGRGSLSIIPEPDARALARGTRQVLANTPAVDVSRPRPAARGPIPTRAGRPSPIRHVFYVFKENRSYDNVFGDLPQGNGDSSLCIFGADVTPNHHALACGYVLLDNTYCDADGSSDGHNWGMAAYASDYVTKSRVVSPIYDYEGGNPLAYPSSGYLWDTCRRHGVSFRSYGEFVFNPDDPRDTVRAAIAGLEGHVAPRYRGYDTNYSDLDRYRAWLEEFDRYDRDGGLPQLSIIRLPNDHTEGTRTGRPTPRAHVAENDLALGLMVERISHSRYWKESLILVIEDDAANGPDHVDAHRTVALAIGPYVRRGAVDSRLYTNASFLRTIELILGLPPMSQFDAAARSLAASFTATPDLTPFRHEEARVDLNETNLAGAYGQERCDRMNFRAADAVPPDELNEILWRDARGATAVVPPLVRGMFTVRLASIAGPGRERD